MDRSQAGAIVTRQPVILLVEDDPDDRFLSERALARAGLRDVRHAENGRVAIDYLQGENGFRDRAEFPLPDVVLLDLKLPEINGHQVLEWIDTQPHLARQLVYILSSSGELRDRERSAKAHAAGYFVKPLNGGHITEILGGFSAKSP